VAIVAQTLHGAAVLLVAQREERRHLSDRVADAAIPNRYAPRAAESADQRRWRFNYGAGLLDGQRPRQMLGCRLARTIDRKIALHYMGLGSIVSS
jgi:hypothetical protein